MEKKTEKILNGNSSPAIISWLIKCPVCKSGWLAGTAKKKLFGLLTTKSAKCNKCSAFFMGHGGKYKLAEVQDTSISVWRNYGKETLTKREWKNIAHGGMSDAKQKMVDDRQKMVDMEEWMSAIKEGRVPIKFGRGISLPILLKKGEELQCVIPNVLLKEPRSVRVSSGGHAGVSFRLAKGLYYRTGSFGSRSESHEEMKVVDMKGILTLTDRRIVFSGSKRTLNVKLEKVISIEPYKDGIALRREGKEKIQYFIWPKNIVQLIATVEDRVYKEPFSGLIFKYMVEGVRNKE